jgi:hypothetical protein
MYDAFIYMRTSCFHALLHEFSTMASQQTRLCNTHTHTHTAYMAPAQLEQQGISLSTLKSLDLLAYMKNKAPLLATGVTDFGKSDDFLAGKGGKKKRLIAAKHGENGEKKRAVVEADGEKASDRLVIAYKGPGEELRVHVCVCVRACLCLFVCVSIHI